MKKKNFGGFALVAILFVAIFGSCKKENCAPDQSSVSSNAVSSVDALPLTYYSCNRAVNVFDPPLNTYYSFALQFGTQYFKYGISTSASNYGGLDFSNIDKFSFEFSGVYADKGNSVKLYRIRRTDGLYLSWGVQWIPKIESSSSIFQFWLISKTGTNKYNLMLPKLSTCTLMRTYGNDLGYRAGVVSSDNSNYSGTTDIFMLPEISKPPVTR